MRECNWSGPNEGRKIIEIGAVKLDGADGLGELIAFENLVHPTRNPILSSYLTDLTGITQTLVDNEATPFRDAITLFEGFVGSDGAPILGFSQHAKFLRHNCALNDLPVRSPIPSSIISPQPSPPPPAATRAAH